MTPALWFVAGFATCLAMLAAGAVAITRRLSDPRSDPNAL